MGYSRRCSREYRLLQGLSEHSKMQGSFREEWWPLRRQRAAGMYPFKGHRPRDDSAGLLSAVMLAMSAP